MKTEDQIRQELKDIDGFIKMIEDRLLSSPDSEYKPMTLGETMEKIREDVDPHDRDIFLDGLWRGRQDALDWVLGNIDDMYIYDQNMRPGRFELPTSILSG